MGNGGIRRKEAVLSSATEANVAFREEGRVDGRPWWGHAAIVTIALALPFVSGCAPRTRPFTDSRGEVIAASIARMEVIEIGGVRQAVWFRGRDRSAPPLILVHGGPGASTSALFRRFVPQLEDGFLVVYWEQRGAGRSYRSNLPRETMTIERMEQDLDELVDLVRARFGAERVVVLGHSWGTILGTRYAHRHPEKLAAYVGVAQIADFERGKRLSLEWATERARVRHDGRALRRLRAMAPVPGSVSEELELGRWVERFGGLSRDGLSTGRLIWAALRTDEANLVDVWKFGAGNRFSLRALRAEYSRVDLTRLRAFRVPVVFLLGRHDWHVPAVEAIRYFEALEAPCKRLVLFDGAAHNPPFEQPQEFVQSMFTIVLPMARGGCSSRDRPA